MIILVFTAQNVYATTSERNQCIQDAYDQYNPLVMSCEQYYGTSYYEICRGIYYGQWSAALDICDDIPLDDTYSSHNF